MRRCQEKHIADIMKRSDSPADYSIDHQDNPPVTEENRNFLAFLIGKRMSSRPRLMLRQELLLAFMPTAGVLLMLACVEALNGQRLLFASLASSAFLIYIDPDHPANRVRTLIVAQGAAAILGFASAWFFGPGYLAAGVAMVLTILLLISLNAMHPPAASTAITAAFAMVSLKSLGLFEISVIFIASLVGLQQIGIWLIGKQVAGRAGS